MIIGLVKLRERKCRQALPEITKPSHNKPYAPPWTSSIRGKSEPEINWRSVMNLIPNNTESKK